MPNLVQDLICNSSQLYLSLERLSSTLTLCAYSLRLSTMCALFLDPHLALRRVIAHLWIDFLLLCRFACWDARLTRAQNYQEAKLTMAQEWQSPAHPWGLSRAERWQALIAAAPALSPLAVGWGRIIGYYLAPPTGTMAPWYLVRINSAVSSEVRALTKAFISSVSALSLLATKMLTYGESAFSM